MRVTEILILVAVAPSAGFALLSRNPPDWVKLLAGIAGLLSAVQFLSSAYRWQMLPAYLLVAVCCLALLWPKIFKLGIPFGLAGFVLLASAAVLSTLLPVFDFPPLTGPFPVGTVTLHLIDSNRTELFSPDPSAKRELMIQIWYPAAGKGPRAFYLPRAAVDLKHAHLALVRTRAMTSVPVSSTESSYPVLIFRPSWNGGKAQNTFQTEELASHGFIVVGIDHPYGTNITVFPDGRRVYSKLYSWLDLSSDEALRESERAAEQQLAIRTADVHFVLTELERLNQHDP